MDISKFKRDASKVHATLKDAGDRTITTTGCRILIPARYKEQKLARMKEDTHILGVFAILLEDGTYGVSLAPAMIKTQPDKVLELKIDGVSYIELSYDKGSSVIANNDVVQDNTLLYNVWKEFIDGGHVPWFITYEDLGKLFSLAKYYTGTKLGANQQIIEMVVAVISRDSNKLNKQYRHSIEKMSDVINNPPTTIKLTNVSYGATNTTSKLIGGYWKEGLNSALLNPSDKVEPIEDLLRK
ncbi:MAG: hypothetical protein IBX57_00980 [Gammaproteobacteria bacterium]|nr:hypothetical protein [Gammaproteobacteria bacterium]